MLLKKLHQMRVAVSSSRKELRDNLKGKTI